MITLYFTVLAVSIVAMLAVLGFGFFALIKDRGNRSRRTLMFLKWRVRLGLFIIALLVLGILTGIISPGAPWDKDPFALVI